MPQAVSTCFSKYASFHGRAPRSEFWWFALFCIIVELLLTGFVYAIMNDNLIAIFLPGLFGLAIALPGLSVMIRRFHDTNRSGWWWFIQLVPAIGGLWLLYLMIMRGTLGPNRFGA